MLGLKLTPNEKRCVKTNTAVSHDWNANAFGRLRDQRTRFRISVPGTGFWTLINAGSWVMVFVSP